MDIKRIIGVVIIEVCLIALLVFSLIEYQYNASDKKLSESLASEEIPLSAQQGLGSLCSDEKACQEFCLNNRGRCEEYCHGRKIELCTRIFQPTQGGASSSSQQNSPSSENCISNPSPVFTHPFTDITKITWISRYGNNALINPGAQARSYVSVKKGESAPVYTPINATITKLTYTNRRYTNNTNPEYRIDIRVSCEVVIAFDHVVALVDKFKEKAPQIPANKTSEGNLVSIPVEAGELIGYTSSAFGSTGFDFLFMNRAKPHPHLNPSRWTSDHSLYKGCPYNYFTEDLKQQYLALIEEEKSMRDCGPRVVEKQGTPLGYWFQENATEGGGFKGMETEEKGNRFVIWEGKHFAEWTFIKENIPFKAFRGSNDQRTPVETLTEGRSACYFDTEMNYYVYLKMLPNDQLALNSGAGSCPASFPEKYEIWVR